MSLEKLQLEQYKSLDQLKKLYFGIYVMRGEWYEVGGGSESKGFDPYTDDKVFMDLVEIEKRLCDLVEILETRYK